MDNLEVLLRNKYSFDAGFGNILVSNLEHDACSFYTDKNSLFFYLYSTDNISCIGENIEHVKHLKYLTLRQVLFVTTDYLLIVHDQQSNQLRTVYTLPTKISTISWNPNETILVILDSNSILHAFTFECNTSLQKFELSPLAKAHLDDAVPNSVYVGWGSHNTQFKGSKKTQEIVEEFNQEYDSPLISWRGNGEQFVINFWKQAKRFLKVFDATLKPLYESSSHPNLLKPTSFKGQGNFIACVAGTSLGNKPYQKVVIFEKNCLMKSEFVVPENKGEIKRILYHPDQNLLAVYSIEGSGYSYLNIYWLSNAHWYLKQQMIYSPDEIVENFEWTNVFEKSVFKLDVLTSKSLDQMVFRSVINRIPNTAVVSVIDGREVYFINYSDKILPPPMFLGSQLCPFLIAENPVNKILCHPSEKAFICLDSAEKEYHYQYVNDTIEEKVLFSLDAPFLAQKTNHLEFNDTQEVLEPLDLSEAENSFLIYLTAYKIDNKVYEFAIDRKQDLLINKSVMCNNVLSLYIYENYLLFTHASSKLYCIRITAENVNKTVWKLNEYYSREIEQGAKIVCVTNTPEIILELPRGNLEAITCRLISIDIVEKMLAKSQWKEAISFIRKQRLNWNLLIDLNPERFSNNLKHFVEASESISVLNQIITEFSNQNCLNTMYSHCAHDIRSLQNSSFNKHKTMLEILKYIIDIDPISNLISIVNLQMKHFSLKSALKSVCSVFEAGDIELCKKAVFQILLYSHNKDVISTSFCLYNIDFMNFIYSCCSEDPRMFEPELEKLKKIADPVELRFEMNLFAKNMNAATKYLVNTTKYEDNFIIDFILKNNTQIVAYENVTPTNPNFILCSNLLAKFLSIKSKHDEAGFILYKANLFPEALIEYKLALNCPKVLSLIAQLKLNDEEQKKLLSELAKMLLNEKRIDEAVNLYEHYLQNSRKAIEVLVEKNMFQKALCKAIKYGYLDLVEESIKPAILKYRTDLHDKITDLKTTFLNHAERLEKVRCKRLTNLQHRQNEDIAEGMGDDFDIYSEYGSILSSRGSTISSNRSKMSTMSSRQRRKQDKKKLDLREGGVYEDIALIRHLHNLILDIFACGPDVREVCLTLTDNESFEHCKELHRNLSDAQDLVEVFIPRIWSDVFVNSPESTKIEVLAVIFNREELDTEFRTPPVIEKMDTSWKLSFFK